MAGKQIDIIAVLARNMVMNRISIAIFIFLFGLFLVPKVFAIGCDVPVYINGTTQSASINFASTGGDNQQEVETPFTATSSATICGIKVNLAKYGSPVNKVVIGIRDSQSGLDLVSTTLNGTDLTTSLADYTQYFTTPFTMTSGTLYYVNYAVDTNRSESNRYVAGQTTDVSAGITYMLWSTGSWYVDGGDRSLLFTLYKESETTPSSTPSSSVSAGTYDYTSVCDTTTDASGTISEKCYNPVMVQVFYILDFLFFGVALGVSIYVLNKVFKI